MSINDNTTMFYNAKPHLFEKAKVLRNNMTNTERLLWEHLKSRKMLNLKFRAQHPIDIFIADFYCHPLKLVIEIDGGIHNQKEQKEYDIGREDELKNLGIKIIRFTNEEIENDIDTVLNQIKDTCIYLKTNAKIPD